jgi:hypothetical protein
METGNQNQALNEAARRAKLGRVKVNIYRRDVAAADAPFPSRYYVRGESEGAPEGAELMATIDGAAGTIAHPGESPQPIEGWDTRVEFKTWRE